MNKIKSHKNLPLSKYLPLFWFIHDLEQKNNTSMMQSKSLHLLFLSLSLTYTLSHSLNPFINCNTTFCSHILSNRQCQLFFTKPDILTKRIILNLFMFGLICVLIYHKACIKNISSAVCSGCFSSQWWCHSSALITHVAEGQFW